MLNIVSLKIPNKIFNMAMPTSFANYKSHMFRSVVTQVDGVYTDFSSVFDTSNHNIFRTNFCCALIYLVRFASHVKEGTCFGECPPFLIFVLRRIYAEYFTNGVVICFAGSATTRRSIKIYNCRHAGANKRRI
jgi:hypothetical protein